MEQKTIILNWVVQIQAYKDLMFSFLDESSYMSVYLEYTYRSEILWDRGAFKGVYIECIAIKVKDRKWNRKEIIEVANGRALWRKEYREV